MVINILFRTDQKLRSGWRFALFVFGFVFLIFFFSATAMVVFPGLMQPDGTTSPANLLLSQIVMFLAALIMGLICTKAFDRMPFSALGLTIRRRSVSNLLLGSVIGAATVSLAAGLALLFGSTDFVISGSTASNILRSAAVAGVVFLVGSVAEEVLFRGYMLQTFVRSHLKLFAILLTSILFASVHQGNPGANQLGWLNTFLAGIWFALAYLKTGELWFVTGLHFAWNWLQGSLFGIEVSGLTDIAPHPILKEVETGPAWVGGGSYGLEAGIVTTIAVSLSIVAVYFLPIKTEPLTEPTTPSEP